MVITFLSDLVRAEVGGQCHVLGQGLSEIDPVGDVGDVCLHDVPYRLGCDGV